MIAATDIFRRGLAPMGRGTRQIAGAGTPTRYDHAFPGVAVSGDRSELWDMFAGKAWGYATSLSESDASDGAPPTGP